jgi:hypothetical protein
MDGSISEHGEKDESQAKVKKYKNKIKNKEKKDDGGM